MDKEWLISKLKEYSKKGYVPMHMPGHKRNAESRGYLKELGAELDVTEIFDFDDLNDPRGIFLESEKIASSLWKCEKTLYSVNGSTSCILAAVRAASKRGDSVIVARNCHKSVYHAMEMNSISPYFIFPKVINEFGICGSVSPEAIEEAIERRPAAAAVILTSPTYEGIISDISAICDIAHKRGIPVIVDEAHGAHLGLFGAFPDGAVSCGADVVVHSFHKTLFSLTQTAAVHLQGNLIDFEEVARQMAIFQTSSPSYILSASIDGCVRDMTENGVEILSGWKRILDEFYEKTKNLKNIKILRDDNISGAYSRDPGKILALSLDGKALAERIRAEFGIEAEMASLDKTLFMTGAGDSSATMEALSDALTALDKDFGARACRTDYHAIRVPTADMSAEKALNLKWRRVPLQKAAGEVSADYVWVQPPGVPIIIPGEIIDEETVGALTSYIEGGITVSGVENGVVRVVER